MGDSGRRMGADLYALYRAGRVEMPEMAALCSRSTSAVHDVAQRLAFLSASIGDPPAFDVVAELRDELHHALRRTALVLRDTGEALVRVADDLARTDRAASDELDRLRRDHAALLAGPTPVPDPPAPDDAFATAYAPPPLDPPERPSLVEALVAPACGTAAALDRWLDRWLDRQGPDTARGTAAR